MVLIGYLGVVYIPFAICVGLIWFLGATGFRKMRGLPLNQAIRLSFKEAVICIILLAVALLLFGLLSFTIGY